MSLVNILDVFQRKRIFSLVNDADLIAMFKVNKEVL